MYNILHIMTGENIIELGCLQEKYNLKTVSSLEYNVLSNIDIVLLSITSFEENDIKIANDIKNNYNIPIIFISSNTTNADIDKYFLYGDDYISASFNQFELLNKIDTLLKLKELHLKFEEEKLFNKSIMESSSNILFIQGNKGIIKANNVFLNFFHIENIKEFNDKHKCISEVFMEYENFYSKYILNNDKNWLSQLSDDKKSNDYKILMMDINTFEPKAFQIYVTALDNSDRFLVTLTDITKITIKSKKYEIQATYDNLTKVYNRTKFNELIQMKYDDWQLTKTALSFAIFDIDFFKIVNDEYGHIVGDETLVTFAETINNAMRDTDIFARWGGEEFTLLLPNTDIDESYRIVEELRIIIENTKFAIIGHKTCSIGVTQFKDNDTINNVIERADSALYEAKESGRNKVCIS